MKSLLRLLPLITVFLIGCSSGSSNPESTSGSQLSENETNTQVVEGNSVATADEWQSHTTNLKPFTDGNGRTGRILNILFLCDQQLITIPVLYLSSFINKNKSDYYNLLLSVTSDGNWTDWIEYML